MPVMAKRVAKNFTHLSLNSTRLSGAKKKNTPKTEKLSISI